MIKKYQYSDGAGYVVTGTDREIRSLYKRMTKREEFVPTFCDFPILSYGRRYGISVTDDENDSYISWFHVVNASTVLALLDDNLLVSEGEGGKMMDVFYKRMRRIKKSSSSAPKLNVQSGIWIAFERRKNECLYTNLEYGRLY